MMLWAGGKLLPYYKEMSSPETQLHIFTVHELTRYLRVLIERDATLQDVRVRGEVSNCKVHRSGHIYFTLKDEHSELRCVLFRETAAWLDFLPQDGLRVVAGGRISVYERGGVYQLYVEEIASDGVGALYLAFEQLKRKLEAEGLFAPERRKPVPAFPCFIALLTSTDGAAMHDFVTIARRRWKGIRILVVPTVVQGSAAPASIVRSLAIAAGQPDVEVAVLARGGGSLEELWAFNTEEVARAIAACPLPTVSAVGHETDFTIADMVADRRAPTPSAAAEMLVPDAAQISAGLRQLARRGSNALQRRGQQLRRELQLLLARRPLAQPLSLVAEQRQRLDEFRTAAREAIAELVQAKEQAVSNLTSRASALSPLAVLSRGYSVLRILPGGEVARSAAQLCPGKEIEALLHDGSATCDVKEVRKQRAQGKEQGAGR
jgi:exodeoxyribonuclease VII large subunit